MKLQTPFCPQCGAPAQGTLERLCGRADFNVDPGPGVEVEYGGDTKIWWDEQRTVLEQDDEPETPTNRPIVCCSEGYTWPTIIEW